MNNTFDVVNCDALTLLQKYADESVDMIYTDPPFGTGKKQVMGRKKNGKVISKTQYADPKQQYLSFMTDHIKEMHRVLKDTGTLYLHLDWHFGHHVRCILDNVFGEENFLNEIIWSYDFGARGRTCWPKKHDNIYVYAKEKGKHKFNWDKIDRIPYMAPGLQKDKARAAAGKVPTDVWWMSIVGTQSKERVGYPTQKPVALVKRMIVASSDENDIILDPFAGSGTTLAAALKTNRSCATSDMNVSAIDIMKERFKSYSQVNFS
jgi:site-specific DNA-methyltransferase (adenine-specific)